jgi:hypothetical protein
MLERKGTDEFEGYGATSSIWSGKAVLWWGMDWLALIRIPKDPPTYEIYVWEKQAAPWSG